MINQQNLKIDVTTSCLGFLPKSYKQKGLEPSVEPNPRFNVHPTLLCEALDVNDKFSQRPFHLTA